jgi:hydrogenase-4 membrane subunit HyfE
MNPQEEQAFADRMVRVHLRGSGTTLSNAEKVLGLEKRLRRLTAMLVLNVLVVIFYAYAFYMSLTQLEPLVFGLIFGAFMLNVLLIVYQRKQISRAIDFLKLEGNEG